MTDPLERIRLLIARAAHPGTPVEEARSSAVIACRAIAQHGIVLSLPGDPGMSPGVAVAVDIMDFLRQVMEDERRRRSETSGSPAASEKKKRQRYLLPCPRCGKALYVYKKRIACGSCEYESPVDEALRCKDCMARPMAPGRIDKRCQNCGAWADRRPG